MAATNQRQGWWQLIAGLGVVPRAQVWDTLVGRRGTGSERER
jgi:hypothetical protein